MSRSIHTPAPDIPPAPTGGWNVRPPGKQRNKWIASLLIVVCVGLVAMWVYAFWFASKKAAYRVDDARWRAEAETICAKYEARRLELVDTSEGYIDRPTEAQMLERADIVDRATDLLESEIDDIVALPVATQQDRDLIAEYEGFFDTLLSDRRAYTAQLRTFVVEPYVESKVAGGPVTNIILDFTTVNEIPSCQPPGELGGDA